MLAVSVCRGQNGVTEVEGVMNKPKIAKINFWTFHASGYRHIHHLNYLQLSIDSESSRPANEVHRIRIEELLDEFTSDPKDVAKQAAYLSDSDLYSNTQVEQALEIARTSLRSHSTISGLRQEWMHDHSHRY